MNRLAGLYQGLGPERFAEKMIEIEPFVSKMAVISKSLRGLPVFRDLKQGYCEMIFPTSYSDEGLSENKNAMLLYRGVELVAGLMTEASIPESGSWSLTGMNIKYRSSPLGDVRFIAEGVSIDWSLPGDIEISAKVLDSTESLIFSAQVFLSLGSKNI